MNSEMMNALSITEAIAQYDESAKRLLGQKRILAHILVKTVEEFKGMNPGEVVDYIDGEPAIGIVPLDPGVTNKEDHGKKIRLVGLNTENSEIAEGMIRFDIIFYVRIPGAQQNERAQIIVNIEAQKKNPTYYNILNRAIFYVCRMVSSQKERDFVKSNYNDIKKVYSIWICMNMDENTMSHVHLTKEDLIGKYEWKGNLDILNIVMIGLGKDLPKHDDKYELHRLLGALLSQMLTNREKIDILEQEYNIPMKIYEGKDAGQMCNLGEGIWERGIEEGITQGIELGRAEGRAEGKAEVIQELIISMSANGMSVEQIAKVTGKDPTEIEDVLHSKICI